MNEEPIVSGARAQRNAFPILVDSPLQESYKKDTTHFINFIQNTPFLDGAVLATLDLDFCSLYTNILQEKAIEVVFQYYQEHCQSRTPTLHHHSGDLMRLILKEISFKFNDKQYLQTPWNSYGHKNGHCRHFYGTH